MAFSFKRLPIRIRLSVSYALSVAFALALFGSAVYATMWNDLESHLDAKLVEGATFFGNRLNHQFREGESIQYSVEALVRKSPFSSLSLEIYGPTGDLLASSPDLGGAAVGTAIAAGSVPFNGAGLARSRVIGAPFSGTGAEAAAIRVVHQATGEPYTIVSYARREDVDATLGTLMRLILALSTILLAFAGVAGYVLASRSLAPVVAMATQVRRMGAEHLSERIVAENPADELGSLAVTFNQLLERIESAFERTRRFVADASHELRTPLSVIRSEADVALTPPTSKSESLESLTVIRDEASRIARLVDDMFLLARADAHEFDVVATECIKLTDLLETSARAASPLGATRSVAVVVGECATNLAWRGDRARLGQLMSNLLDNATKYAGAGGTVTLAAHPVDDALVAVTVSDNGPGIPREMREVVFDRFVCVDKARTRSAGGSGLGLPISRSIAEAHGGSLALTENTPSGCVFTVLLPSFDRKVPSQEFILASSADC